MKKILLVLFAFMFLSSLCFAESGKKVVTKHIEHNTITGKIVSVSLGDQAKGTKSEIVVLTKKGIKITFTVPPSATISDKDEKNPTLDKIAKADKVIVKYVTTKGGVKEAVSVKSIE